MFQLWEETYFMEKSCYKYKKDKSLSFVLDISPKHHLGSVYNHLSCFLDGLGMK